MANADKQRAAVAAGRGTSYGRGLRCSAPASPFAPPTRPSNASSFAIQAYELNAEFRPFSSKYDVFRRRAAFSDAEPVAAGLLLRPAMGNCAVCYPSGGGHRRRHAHLTSY